MKSIVRVRRLWPVLALGWLAGAAGAAFASLALVREANTTLRRPLDATSLPARLSETGAFADLNTLTPEQGIVPFEVNVSLWSDGAHKRRWFSLPNTADAITFRREGRYEFPTGTVFIKHFELELTNGIPASVRRLETRFLVRLTNGVLAFTYRWNDAMDDAMLVPASGANSNYVVQDAGLTRTQVWRFPSRSECLRCHNAGAGFVLGFNTAQLNRDCDYPAGSDNQIRALSRAGFFQTNVTGRHTLRALAAATDENVSLEYRVRSYLAANCLHCHQTGTECGQRKVGTQTNFSFTADLFTPLSEARLINQPAVWSGVGDANSRLIKPGDPAGSILLTRLTNMQAGVHMPPLATSEPDQQAIALVRRWIATDLRGYQSFPEWQLAWFRVTNAPGSGPMEDADGDGAPNLLEYLTFDEPLWKSPNWVQLAVRPAPTGMRLTFPRLPWRGMEVEWTTDIGSGASWQPLDVPSNAPFFPGLASAGMAVVEDPDHSAARKFYRLRIYEP